MSSNSDDGPENDSDASESSFELPDALATGREKRQTAGNRLRDMLNAELESEAIFAEDAEDDDFGSDQDQQDDLDSELDSDSSDDQAAIEAEDAGEKQLQRQEKDIARAKKRKAAEAFRVAKPVNNAASRRVQTGSKPSQHKRQVSFLTRPTTAKRQSTRAHAVEIAGAVEKRLVQEADKKAKIAKTARVEERPLTQAERLEEAKLTEAKNVASLSEIVKYEEDKKANQRLLAARRKAIGPFIRFVSSSRTSHEHATTESELNPVNPAKHTLEVPSLIHPLDALGSAVDANGSRSDPSTTSREHTARQMMPQETKSVKQYLSIQNPANPEGVDSMHVLQAIFGHIPDARKSAPQKTMCSLSGVVARYRDPDTHIPYGNLHAYNMLKELRTGTIPWNPQLKMYVPRSTLQ